MLSKFDGQPMYSEEDEGEIILPKVSIWKCEWAQSGTLQSTILFLSVCRDVIYIFK